MSFTPFARACFLRFALCLLTIAAGTQLRAQSPTGSISGVIKDSTGAAVNGAAVQAVKVDTQTPYSSVSTGDGNYALPSLPIGQYTLRVTATGFKSDERTGLTLVVDQHAAIDFSLQLGALSETVSVNADTNQTDTETHSVGTVVDEQKLEQLPLNSRTFVSLAYIVPGVYPPVVGSSLGFRGGFNVAGASESSNNFSLDGFDNNNDQQNIPSYRPSVDAIAEFKILTGLYAAEYGRNQGGQVIVTGKSGTNAFHGSLFEYIRNQLFDARNTFATSGSKPGYKRNQFGGSLGGAIRKDKAFFFFSYEGLRVREQVIALATLPNPTWASTGDLSSLLPLVQLKNPFVAGSPIIPNNNLALLPQWSAKASTVGRALASYYPTPTRTTANGAAPLNNYDFYGPRQESANQYALRIDQTFSPRDSAYAEYNYYNDQSTEPSNSLCGARVLPGFGCYSGLPLGLFGLSETHIFTPRMLNTVRVAYNRYEQSRLQQDGNIDFVGQNGLTNVFSQALSTNLGVPATSVTSYATIGGPNNIPQDFVNNTYELADQVILSRSAHTFKFGMDLRRVQQNSLSIQNGRGVFTFTAASSAPTTGYAFADLLLGYPTSTSNNPLGPKIYVRTTGFYGYAQDDWKLNSRLTLNLGIRWELNTPFTSANDQLSNFDPAFYNTPSHGLVVADTNGNGRNIIRYDFSKFLPRVGFAFAVDPKTVLRGGYGINAGTLPTFSPIGNLYYNPPMRNPQTFQSTAVVATALTLANPFPTSTVAGTATVTAINPNFLTSYIQQFGLGLQRQLTPNTLLDVSYFGSKGTHLLTQTNINQPPPSTLATSALVNATRPFPIYGNITEYLSSAASSFNSLQVKLDQRLSHGVNALVSYTYSKSLDNALSANPQNASDLSTEYGPSDFDARHRFVLSGFYRLPWGHDGMWLKSGIGSAIAGGWQLATIFSTQTGHQLTPVYGGNISNTFNTRDRPNVIADPNNGPKTRQLWFNKAAFVAPAKGVFGNAGRNDILSPPYTDFDVTLSRSFPLPREASLQFRAEFFNVANHPNLDQPNTTADSAAFGSISTAEAPRQMQFALRVHF